jgi:hypothetical protein
VEEKNKAQAARERENVVNSDEIGAVMLRGRVKLAKSIKFVKGNR